MPDPGRHPGASERRDASRTLRHVKAAQLRNKAIRWGIGKSIFGSVFLLGALAHAYAPGHLLPTSRLWMALLVMLSTFHVGLGLRTFARARRGRGPAGAAKLWLPATVAWGVLATVLVRILLLRQS